MLTKSDPPSAGRDASSSAEAAEGGADFPPRWQATYALILLMVGSLISLLDRQMLSLLIVPIKADVAISDVQISLLQGLAFSLLYLIASIPLGLMADRFNRRNLIVVGMLLWSAMTMYCGLAHNFWQLFVGRVGVGLGEACLQPAGASLIADYFAPQLRARAFSFMNGAAAAGIATSMLAGSALIAAMSSGPLRHMEMLRALPVWRAAFLLAGLPGIAFSCILLTMREPGRREVMRAAQSAPSGFETYFRRYRGILGTVLSIYGLINLATYGLLGWTVAAYVRTFRVGTAEASYLVGVILMIGTAVGALWAGVMADRWSRLGRLGGKLNVPMSASFSMAILVVAWWAVRDRGANEVLGSLTFLAMMAASSSASAVIAELTPNDFRGRVYGIFLFTSGAVGITLGPLAVAFVTQYVFRSEAALPYAIVSVVAPTMLLAGLIAWATRGRYSAAVASVAAVAQG